MFTNSFDLERSSDEVLAGKVLEKQFYQDKEEFHAGNFVIDFYEDRIVHEVKQSKRFHIQHLMQAAFYFHALTDRGYDPQGIALHYPVVRQVKRFGLGEIPEVYETLKEIELIIDSDMPPPKLENRKGCKKCAYERLCWV